MILLRLIPTATHTDEDIDITVKAFVAIKDKLLSGAYRKAEIVQPD
jgi:glycine C-acetyltransferase